MIVDPGGLIGLSWLVLQVVPRKALIVEHRKGIILVVHQRRVEKPLQKHANPLKLGCPNWVRGFANQVCVS